MHTGECDCCGMWSTDHPRVWYLNYMETFACATCRGMQMKMKKIRNPQIWWRKHDELVREIAKAKRQRKKQSDLQREAVHVLASIMQWEIRHG